MTTRSDEVGPPTSTEEWQSITSWTITKELPVQLAKVTGKGFGLVAARALEKGQVVFVERAPVGGTIVMPTRTPPAHCATCFRCMEPANAFFDEELPMQHLWPNPDFGEEWVQALADGEDEVTLPKYFEDEHGRILCRACKSIFCSKDCQKIFEMQILRDCCLCQRLMSALADVAFQHDDRNASSDHWEIVLASRLMMATFLAREPSSLALEEAMKGMCGTADQKSVLRAGIPLDHDAYTLEPFHQAVCQALCLSEDQVSLESFERLVVVSRRNSVDIQPSSLFAAYETSLIQECRAQGHDHKPLLEKIARMIAKQSATARMNTSQYGVVDCCAILPLFSRINHSCQPNLAVCDRGPLPSVQLVAARDIAQGEEVTLCYLSEASILLDQAQRNLQLQSSYLFSCQCGRCNQEREEKGCS